MMWPVHSRVRCCRFFLIFGVFGTLCHSPTFGAIGCGFFCITLGASCYFIAPTRYLSVMLLHEEVKRFLLDQSGSFLKQAEESGQVVSEVAPESSFGKRVLDISRRRSCTTGSTQILRALGTSSSSSTPRLEEGGTTVRTASPIKRRASSSKRVSLESTEENP